MPRSGWPIEFADLARYYGKAFDLLGIPRAMQDDGVVWRGVTKDVPGLGSGVEVFLTRWMNEPNVARFAAVDIDRSSHLHVLTGHAAVGFRGEGSRITAIDISERAGRRHMLPCDRLVLAAGTIENVRLMLWGAADQSWSCPWAGNRMLGRRFQDHLVGRAGVLRAIDRRRLADLFCTIRWKGLKFQPKVRLSQEVLSELRIPGAQAMVSFEGSFSEHLVFLKQFLKAAVYSRKVSGLGDFVRHSIACGRHLPPLMWTYLRQHRIGMPGGAQVVLHVQIEQEPIDESRIRIDLDRRDAHGLPRVELDWRLSGREIESARALADRVGKALREAGIATLEADADLMQPDGHVLDRFTDLYHQTGGCVMARDPSDGVVDGDLKVFGTDNLFVLGACTFPTNSDANVTFTGMALACRLADHLNGNRADADR
jgi:choline dehydrogenase-like flavoprotein